MRQQKAKTIWMYAVAAFMFCSGCIAIGLVLAGVMGSWKSYYPSLRSEDEKLRVEAVEIDDAGNEAFLADAKNETFLASVRCKDQEEVLSECGVWIRAIDECLARGQGNRRLVEYPAASLECIAGLEAEDREKNIERRENEEESSREFRRVWIIVFPTIAGIALAAFIIGIIVFIITYLIYVNKSSGYCTIAP